MIRSGSIAWSGKRGAEVVYPRPPILGGAESEAGARRVARWGLPLHWIDRRISDVYLKTLAERGRPLENSGDRRVLESFLCDDPDAMWQACRQNVLYQRKAPYVVLSQYLWPAGIATQYRPVTTDSIEENVGLAPYWL